AAWRHRMAPPTTSCQENRPAAMARWRSPSHVRMQGSPARMSLNTACAHGAAAPVWCSRHVSEACDGSPVPYQCTPDVLVSLNAAQAYVFHLKEVVHAIHRAFATQAGLLDPAER